MTSESNDRKLYGMVTENTLEIRQFLLFLAINSSENLAFQKYQSLLLIIPGLFILITTEHLLLNLKWWSLVSVKGIRFRNVDGLKHPVKRWIHESTNQLATFIYIFFIVLFRRNHISKCIKAYRYLALHICWKQFIQKYIFRISYRSDI